MTGDVGIFWVDQGQLIMAAVPVADGVDDGIFVNRPYIHDPYREIVQRTHVHLWGLEYHQAPRGRMLFNKTENHFCVYLDQVLCKAMIKRMIVARFHLPRRQPMFRTDLHDLTDPDERDRVFAQ